MGTRTWGFRSGALLLLAAVGPACGGGGGGGGGSPPPPGAFDLLTPASGATNLSTQPLFTWTAAPDAASYTLEVSPTSAFAGFVLQRTGLAGTSFLPNPPLPEGRTLWWRVSAVNAGGSTLANLAPWSFTTRAYQGQLVAVAGTLRDLVHDRWRSRVYVTNETNNRVEVYDAATATLLAPIAAGTAPWGLDLSADGSRLLVCLSGEANLASVDLTATPPAVTLVPVASDSFGTNRPRTVACAANGKGFFTCVYPGSGASVPREILLSNLQVTLRPDVPFGSVNDPTYLRASGDRSKILFAEGNSSGGPFEVYDSASDTFGIEGSLNRYNSGAAMNADGSRLAILPGPHILAADFRHHAILPNAGIGFAYAPSGNRAYRATGASAALGIFDTARNLEIDQVPAAANLLGPLAVDDAGATVYAIGTGGLLVIPVGANRAPVVEQPGTVPVTAGDTVGITLQAVDPDGDALSWSALLLPPNASFNPASRLLTFAPDPGQAGTSPTAQLSVTDGALAVPVNVTFGVTASATDRSLRIPFAGQLRQMAYHAASGRLYVTNSARNRVEVIDTAAQASLDPIPVGAGPWGVDLNVAGTRLLVAAADSAFLQVVDLTLSPPAVIASIPVPDDSAGPKRRPFDVASAANGRIFATSQSGGSGNSVLSNVWDVDLAGGTMSAPAGLPVSQGGVPLIYVAASADRSRLVFGATGGGYGTNYHFSSPGNAFGPYVGNGMPAGDVSANADGTRFGTLQGPHVMDANLRLLARLVSGFGTGFAFGPGGTRAYRGVLGEARIRVVDTATWLEIDSLVVPSEVTGAMASNGAGTRVFAVSAAGLIVARTDVDRPPRLEPIGTVTVNAGSAVALAVQAVDPDGDAIVYTASGLPANASFNPVTRLLQFSPTVAQVGTLPAAQVSASNAAGMSAQNVTFVVTNPASYPARKVPINGTVGEMAFNPVNGRLYVSNATMNRVEVIDAASSARLDPIPVGSGPTGLDFNLTATKLVVCCGESSFIRVLDMTQVPPAVSVSVVADPASTAWPRASLVAVAANERAFYTFPSGSGPLREFDLATNLVSARADVPSAFLPVYLKSSGDRTLMAAGEGSFATGPLRIYVSSSDTFTSPLATGAGFSNVDANANGSRFLTSAGPRVFDSTPSLLGAVAGFPSRACFRQGAGTTGYRRDSTFTVEVLDLTTYSVSGSFPLPEAPYLWGGMTTDPAGTRLFVVTNTGIAIVDLP